MGHLKVVHPGDGGDNFHIFIDNDYQGNVIRLKSQWVSDLGDTSNLTPDDVQALGKIIDEKFTR